MSTSVKERAEVLQRLDRLGIASHDAQALRRIAMTLHQWFELECGEGNDWGSWAIERDEDTEIPFMVHHHYRHGQGQDTVSRTKVADKESGAYTRLAGIMAKYQTLIHYVQTDPRGASLYIVTKEQIGTDQLESNYSRGIAVS